METPNLRPPDASPLARDTAIDCHDCGQLLAIEFAGGGVRVVAPDHHFSADGRVVIVCPRCSKRIRIRPHRKQV